MGSVVKVDRPWGVSYCDEDDLEECIICGEWCDEVDTEEYYEIFDLNQDEHDGDFEYDPDIDPDVEGIWCCYECGIWWDEEDDSVIHDIS